MGLRLWKRRSGDILSSTLLLLNNCISRDYRLYLFEDTAFRFLHGQDTVSTEKEGINNVHEEIVLTDGSLGNPKDLLCPNYRRAAAPRGTLDPVPQRLGFALKRLCLRCDLIA